MLAGRDEQRPHLACTTQFGEHRRELDALGACSDDEGEGGHFSLGGKLARWHVGKEERQQRGLVDQRLGGSERLTSWPVDKLTSGQGRQRPNSKGNRRPDDWLGAHFQVSGLGSREPGSGVQVRVQVQDLKFPAPVPVPDNPYQRPDGRDLRPENVSPLVNGASGPPSLYSKGYSSPSAKKLWASRRREQPRAVTKVTSSPVAVMRRHQDGSFEP